MARGKVDRAAMRKQVANQSEESYRRKDKGGGFSSYFKTDQDYPFWSAGVTKEDPHVIDIVPFMVGDNCPMDDKGRRLEKGAWAYYLDIYVHQRIGPNESRYVCPAKNYDRPCPICEHIRELRKDGVDYEEYKDIDAKRRNVYNILCYDTEKEENKGIQIFEVSHHYMEKNLQKIAKKPRGGGTILYADPDEGMMIAFQVEDNEMKTISGHQFEPRSVGGKSYVISDEDIGNAYPLDEIVEELSYNELYEIYHGAPVGDAQEQPKEEEAPGGRRSSRFAKEDVDDVSKGVETKCSLGHQFGVDIDKFDDCTQCSDDEYSECTKAKVEEEEKKKSAAKSEGGKRGRRGRSKEAVGDDIPF